MHYLCVPLFLTYTMYTTITTTIIAGSLFFSAYNLFVRNNTCSLDLYSGDLQTTTVLFTHNATSHKSDWITTTCCCMLCVVFKYFCTNSLTNVLEVVCLRSRFFENSCAFFYIACYRVRLSITLLLFFWLV